MRVLIIGSGGREHALAWALAKSPELDGIVCAPGNAGMAALGPCRAVDISDADAVAVLARDEGCGLVVIGPEAPLAAGLADGLTERGLLVVGPSAEGARLESSKAFTKELCARQQIPTAGFERFREAAPLAAYLERLSAPFVLKADGLAQGKGVVIADSRAEALREGEAMLSGRFGDAGREIVVEEFLEGEEASVFVLTDGQTVLPLPPAQDHKRVGEGETGPNTGGMGAYSPAAIVDDAMMARILETIIRPTLEGMAERGTPYRGVLYAGLMIGTEGPKLIEYNVRFGDPEAQVLMMRLQSDLLPALTALAEGRLGEAELAFSTDPALTVVMAAKGYPGAYEKGSPIRNLDAAARVPGVEIFHAGTAFGPGGEIVAAGGRVLNVTATAATLAHAHARAYEAVDLIDWPEGFCRRDIGWRSLG